MKKTILLVTTLLAIMIVIVGCAAPTDPDQTSDYGLAKKAVYPSFAGDGTDGNYVLWADHNIEAGMVTIDENGISITTNDFSDIRGVHIYAWEDEAAIPTHRPEPGHADYVAQNVHSAELYINFPTELYSFFTVYVHLEDGHRAYIGGDVYPLGFPDVKVNWWGYVGYSNVECVPCTECWPC